MLLPAPALHKHGLIDEIVPEPPGGAHRDPKAMAATLKRSLQAALARLLEMPRGELLNRRRERLLAIGDYAESS